MRTTRNARQAGFNIKCQQGLRTRADACAKLEGLSIPDFVRLAIRNECERTEKLHGRRMRAARAADGYADGGYGGAD